MDHEPPPGKRLSTDKRLRIPRISEVQVEVAPGKARSADERQRIERFIQALNQAMVLTGLSQRRLATAIGVESGTFTKYLRGTVDPWKVGSRIQARLAEQLGVTLDALMTYYEVGAYLSGVDINQVESWIRSEAGQENLTQLLEAMREASLRWLEVENSHPKAPKLTPYEWPAEVVEKCGLDEAILEKLGISGKALQALIDEGVIDDALVSGFALVLKVPADSVRSAFEKRLPLD